MSMAKAIAYLFVLIAKTPGLLASYLYGRSRGARCFRQELLRSGMDPKLAEELTQSYKTMIIPQWKRKSRHS